MSLLNKISNLFRRTKKGLDIVEAQEIKHNIDPIKLSKEEELIKDGWQIIRTMSYSNTIVKQFKVHKKKRINKKWRKYGHKIVLIPFRNIVIDKEMKVIIGYPTKVDKYFNKLENGEKFDCNEYSEKIIRI